MLDFKGWINTNVSEGTNPGAKTGLYPLGYGGVGLYPPQWYPTRSADAIFYLSIDDRIYKGKDGGSFDIKHLPGKVNYSLNRGEGGAWKISHLGGSQIRPSGKNFAAKNGDGEPWSIKHIEGNRDVSGPEFVPAAGEGGIWDITNIKGAKGTRKDENAGSFAIVGCEDDPNYQVWGARSDLKCKKKEPRLLNMKFGDWVRRKGKNKNG